MDRLGIQSLHAGAPDLRLTGDQTQRGTYTQRRRNQMAYGGIAGLDGRKAYGLGSWFQEQKDKFVDDIIPNELKESPVGAALVGGALLNQFGLPDALTQKMGMGSNVGQNWLGNLLGTVTGKEGGYNTVLNPSTWFGGSQTGDLPGYTGIINPHADTPEVMRQQGITDMLNYMRQKDSGGIIQNLANAFGLGQTTGSSTGYDAQGKPIINWRGPLTIGTGIGLADYLTRSDDTMPAQLGLDTSRFATAEAAKADPNLRFKPQEQYTLKDGGRIGYAMGKGVESLPVDQMEDIEGQTASPMSSSMMELISYLETLPFDKKLQALEMLPPEIRAEVEARLGLAQGGRIGYRTGKGVESLPVDQMQDIEGQEAGLLREMFKIHGRDQTMSMWNDFKIMKMEGSLPPGIITFEDFIDAHGDMFGGAEGGRVPAQEGGLMDLGGMEKDYRQEGGFVPIGGEEKADDVPARLSKNEFVFTADAVRSAGGGDIDAGAKVMENLMENLEAGGKVSEDSQGLEGAQEMFANTQRLQNRII